MASNTTIKRFSKKVFLEELGHRSRTLRLINKFTDSTGTSQLTNESGVSKHVENLILRAVEYGRWQESMTIHDMVDCSRLGNGTYPTTK